MKNKLIALVLTMALMICGVAGSLVMGAEKSKILVAVNDSIIENPLGVPPVIDRGNILVPVEVFTTYLGVRYSYDSITEILSLYKGGRALYFNRNTGTVADENDITYEQEVLYEYGTFLVPVDFVARYLGFKYAYIATGPIVRVYDKYASLSNTQIADSYKANKDDPKEVVPPVKKDPETGAEGKQDPIKEEQRIKNVYFTFEQSPNENTEAIINTLDRYGIKGTFFVNYEGIVQYPEMIVKMAASGHSVGISLDEGATGEVLSSPMACEAYLKKINSALQKLMKHTTMNVSLNTKNHNPLSQEVQDYLEKEEYHLWSYHTLAENGNISGYNIGKNLKKTLEGKATTSVVRWQSTTQTAIGLERLMAGILKENFMFHTITYVTPPIK